MRDVTKIGLIARHELLTPLKRKGVLFSIFGLPLIVVLVLYAVNWYASSSNGGDVGSALNVFVGGPGDKPAGVVDHTQRLRPYLTPAHNFFLPFDDETAARTALDNGQITGYYVIPADYAETGRALHFTEGIPTGAILFERDTLYSFLANAFLGETAVAARLSSPLENALVIDLSQTTPEEQVDPMNLGMSIVLGVALGILFFMTIIGSAAYLLQSLGTEKQNRVMEILLSSVRPFTLLAGKMIGLAGLGLLQMGVWGLIWLFLGRQNEALLSNMTLPTISAGVWALIVLHFLAGYFVYASLFAGLGALTPGTKESSQYTFLVMLPAFIPLWFANFILTAPRGTVAIVMSIFPLTAPLAMPMRLVITAVPAWQWGLSLAASGLAALVALWLAARLFRSRSLLSGQGISLRLAWQTLRER